MSTPKLIKNGHLVYRSMPEIDFFIYIFSCLKPSNLTWNQNNMDFLSNTVICQKHPFGKNIKCHVYLSVCYIRAPAILESYSGSNLKMTKSIIRDSKILNFYLLIR